MDNYRLPEIAKLWIIITLFFLIIKLAINIIDKHLFTVQTANAIMFERILYEQLF